MPDLSSLEPLDLQVYSATWCSDCRRLEGWLEKNAVAHTVVDIETTEGAAERLEAETGKKAIPFILVNGNCPSGWIRSCWCGNCLPLLNN